jgi:uncharacterized lipoprotein YmbA
MRAATLAALSALAGLLAGCGSTAASNVYTLNGTATAAPSRPSAVSVAVGPVSIPATVDRPQIVVNTSANQVEVDEFNRWASPLQSNISRVVAENLSVLLGAPRVTQSLGVESDFRVAIEVRRFDSMPGDSAILDAAWMVRRVNDGRIETGRTTVQERVPQKGYGALVAAHSRAVGRLSQDIANAVRMLDGAPR